MGLERLAVTPTNPSRSRPSEDAAPAEGDTPRERPSPLAALLPDRTVQRRALGIGATALCLWLPVYLLWLFHRQVLSAPIGYDEQFFVWTGWSVLKGLAPYRDFIEYKPPVLFLTEAVALATFGFAGLKFRYFYLFLAMAAFTAFQASLLSRGAKRLLACALTCAAMNLFSTWKYHDTSLADVESIGQCYYLFAIACLFARTRRRNLFDAVGGAFLALTFFTKEPFGAVVFFTWVTAFFAGERPVDGRAWRTAFIRYLKFTAIGVGAVVLGLCIYMVPTGAMTAYVKQVMSYRDLFRDPTKSYCVLLGRFHPTGSLLGDLPGQWTIIHESFFNLATLGFLAPAAAASLVFLARRSLLLLAASLLSVAGALYAVTASNCYWTHYYLMAMTGIFLFLMLGVRAMSDALRSSSRDVQTWAVGVFVMSVGMPTLLRYNETQPFPIVPPPNPEPIPGVVAFIHAHSTKTDRIFSTGAPGLYVMADRHASLKESSIIDQILESLPGTTDEERVAPLRAQLLKARPKIIVLDPEHPGRKDRFLKALVMPFIQEFGYQQMGPYYYVRSD